MIVKNDSFKCPSLNKGEKIALVLSGGGARGRFQAGALKWIQQIGLLEKVTLIVGTSVGGLNTLSVAKNINNYDKVIDMWNAIKKNSDVYDGKVDFFGVLKVLMFKFKSILNPQGLYRILNDNFKGMKVEDFGIDIAVTSTNLNTNKREVFYPEHTKGIDAVLLGKMTSAIPGMFQAQEVNGCVYVDGGVGNNQPVETAIELGATKVIMVGTSPRNSDKKEIKNNALDVLFATLNAMMDIPEQDMWEDIESKYPNVEILKLYADRDTGNALEFDNAWLMQEGYDTAVRHITEDKVIEFLK